MGSPLICGRTRADPVQPRARDGKFSQKEISFELLAPLRYVRLHLKAASVGQAAMSAFVPIADIDSARNPGDNPGFEER